MKLVRICPYNYPMIIACRAVHPTAVHIRLHPQQKVVWSYRTGTYTSSGQFRAKLCSTWVKQYNKNFDRKTGDWWEGILQHYVVVDSDTERVGNMSILDEQRVALPMSSSL